MLSHFELKGLKRSTHKILSGELEIDLRSRGIADQQHLPAEGLIRPG